MTRFALRLCLVPIACAQASSILPVRAQQVPSGVTSGETWTVEGGTFDGEEDLSGISCASASQCLVVSDETKGAQLCSRAPGKLVVGETGSLVVSGEELDLEAVSFGGGHYFAIGSHGVSRKKAEVRANRYRLFKIPVGADGMPVVNGGAMQGVDESSLQAALRSHLPKHAEKRLQSNGANIEGLALNGDRLYVGFRAPSVSGKVPVMVVETKQAFRAPEVSADAVKLQWVSLEEGVGIRAMSALSSGFLLISGDAGVKKHKDQESPPSHLGNDFKFWFWDGAGEVATSLGKINVAGGKPEGLLVLKEVPGRVRVLILFDSVTNGGPVEYDVVLPNG